MIDKRFSLYAIVFLVIFYVVGIIGLSWVETAPLFIRLIPLTLLLSSLLLVMFHTPFRAKQFWLFAVIFLAGLTAEAIGVNTGMPFGTYYYGDVMGIQVLQTPLLIGLNWAMLIYMVWVIVQDLKMNGWWRIILASLLMVVYDIVLEPFAIHYGMWTWEEVTPPIQNYLTWFGLSFLFFLIIWKAKTEVKNPLALFMFLIQTFFFAVLYLINIY